MLAASFALCLALLFMPRAQNAPSQSQNAATGDSAAEVLPALPAQKTEPSQGTQKTRDTQPAQKPQVPQQQKNTQGVAVAVPPVAKPLPVPRPPAPQDSRVPAAVNGAKLIFVFDDAGQNLVHLAPFLELPFAHTVAVLPRLTHSVESAKRIRAAGKEVMLHQPMQAQNRAISPGPGAITPGMPPAEIKMIVQKNIAEIAPIAGMNNHEGSLITESSEAVGAVLDVCREAHIYFLDSRTTSATAVPAAAKARGMDIWERDVFLDNEPSKDAMLKELIRGLGIANRTGSAIMIGHVWSPALAELLRELHPELARKGYVFSTISALKNSV